MKNEKKYITNTENPSAFICINKSRLRIYNKETDPTFYLNNGDSFQIELFNPTTNYVLAKIYLNNNIISQGGLVLRPGERVFLERYLDVAKRFKFDVYEVSNTEEVQKAIEKNGDFKVEFYSESIPLNSTLTISSNPTFTYKNGYDYYNPQLGTFNTGSYNTRLPIGGSCSTTFFSDSSIGTTSFAASLNTNSLTNSTKRIPRAKLSKTIETGRVETGGQSDQKLQTVNKSFNYYPFHTVEYKLLPISQKVNTIDDINIKRYCTCCGTKIGKTDKFCSNCGNKI